MIVTGRPEPVAGTSAGLGESPVWDPRTGRLLWVDLFDGIRHDTDPMTGSDNPHDSGAACGFVALAEVGIVFARDSQVVHVSSGHERVVAALDPSGQLRINDSQIGPGGSLFCGLMALDRQARVGTGRLVRVDGDGTVTAISEGLSIPNGLGWSPDGSTMFHVDTLGRRVDRFDFDPQTGSATDRRLAFTTERFGGLPDGLSVDEEGRIWLAHFGTPYVICTDDEGEEICRVELPVANVTSCAFGGVDRATLYVTTTTRDATPDQPHAGAVFAVDTSTRGQAPRYFSVGT